MPNDARFWLDPKTWTFLADIGVSPANTLRTAGLPTDLLSRGPVAVNDDAYYRLWQAIDDAIDAPSTAVAVAESVSTEVLVAPMFAAMCAADLVGAAHRLAQFKPLISGSRLLVESHHDGLTITQDWTGCTHPPAELVWAETLFWVRLARIATRLNVVPVAMNGPSVERASRAAIERYAGVAADCHSGGFDDPLPSLEFHTIDASRPFLTADEAMWAYFEPGLRNRLGELDRHAPTTDRVRSLLTELLPGGRGTMKIVADELAISQRTLQRRLNHESTTFQEVIAATRAELAERFLQDADLPFAQIALLVGYEDPTSFHRAYREWTGHTPARGRALAQGVSR